MSTLMYIFVGMANYPVNSCANIARTGMCDRRGFTNQQWIGVCLRQKQKRAVVAAVAVSDYREVDLIHDTSTHAKKHVFLYLILFAAAGNHLPLS